MNQPEKKPRNIGILVAWGVLLTGIALVLPNLIPNVSRRIILGNNSCSKSSAIFASHENKFSCELEIKNMSQVDADLFCQAKFEQLKNSGDIQGLYLNEVVYIWGHGKSGYCIANTR